ncbi:MAG TPA: hypothetical protein DD414_07190 [Lachnospiraceae bacterium]|nr:hypothetical protein [Lachnospiraceae bacterium]
MDRQTILYRGSLKSCNYRCAYCPFSKHPMSGRELEKDKEQWFSFVRAFPEKARELKSRALLVVPYGEALIHPWYWEGLGRISASGQADAVGAQTNLSFSVLDSLDIYLKAGGDLKKLRLWATFHPRMTTVRAFTETCRQLTDAGVLLCVGAVGVPKNLSVIRELKEALPEEIYLWINRMDGLRRRYTEEETEAFLEIDSYFSRELLSFPADPAGCRGRIFMEGDGKVRTCNIGTIQEQPVLTCSRKRCSCYLAYGGRADFMNRILFGPYPLFRIPRRPKAVFFDIDGTLVPQGVSCEEQAVPQDILAGLKALSKEKTRLFFATSLPVKEAMKRCGSISHLFSGGIFAGGAHLLWQDGAQKKEFFYFLDESCLEEAEALKEKLSVRALACRREGRVYKITLCRPAHSSWSSQDIKTVGDRLSGIRDGSLRCFAEGRCLQIVSARATKEEGVKTLCRWMGISPLQAAAAGDSKEDEEMVRICESFLSPLATSP